MATLEEVASGRRIHLAARHIVGRSRSCLLHLARPNVSGVHAEIVWDGEHWCIQDLGSRNGTYVDGRRLASGEHASLRTGVELGFGELHNGFRLLDDTPPKLMAVAETGDVSICDDEILCLPSPDACEVSVFRDSDDRWLVETNEGVTRPLDDQELIVVSGHAWRVFLPAQQGQTREATNLRESPLADVGLELFVSRDGEHISATLKLASGDLPLEPRAHAQLLLTLARCRIEDAKQAHLPTSEHGWVHREDLLGMLAIDPQLLNLWIHRARKQLGSARVRAAAMVIERRPGTQQLRLGIDRLTICAA